MYIDFANVIIGILIIVTGMIALFSVNQVLRMLASIATFLFLISLTSMNVFISMLIFGFLVMHTLSDKFKNMGRYSYILLAIGFLILTPVSVEASSHNNAGGLPGVVERVELVEEVLMITQQPSIDVKGTDYIIGDIGKLQSYLKVGEFPIDNASCFVSVLYPNMTYFIENQLMTNFNLPYFEGLYYHDFIVDNVTGIFPVNSYCFYDSLDYFDTPSSLTNNFTRVEGTIASLQGFDGDQGESFTGGLFDMSIVEQEIISPDSALHLSEGINLTFNDASYNSSLESVGLVTDDNIFTGISLDGSGSGMAFSGTLLLSAAFDETSGTVAVDDSPLGNDGTYIGSPNQNISGSSNTGTEYDGSDDYVAFPAEADYVVGPAEDFVACFAYNSQGSIETNVVMDYDYDFGGWEIQEDGQELRLRVDSSGSGAKSVVMNTVIEDSNTHLICAFFTHDNFGFFLDGTLDVNSSQTFSGTVGNVGNQFWVGREVSGAQFLATAMVDEVCYIRGTGLDITGIAQAYDAAGSCAGTFGNGESDQAIKTSFPFQYDNISSYDLEIRTTDDGIGYDIYPYLNSTDIDLGNSVSFTSDGSFTYNINVTGLVDLMTNTYGLSTSDFRIINNDTGFIYEMSMDRMIVDYSNITTCDDRFCAVDYEFTFPIGWDTNFLFDTRLIVNARDLSDNGVNVSLFNFTSGTYEYAYTLDTGNLLEQTQIPFTMDNVENDTLLVEFSAYDLDNMEELFIERLETSRIYNGSYVYSLRGNNELVVSAGLNNFIVNVTSPEAPIDAVNTDQLGELLILLAIFGFLMVGQFWAAGLILLFYGFFYYDGLITLMTSAFSTLLIMYNVYKVKNNN